MKRVQKKTLQKISGKSSRVKKRFSKSMSKEYDVITVGSATVDVFAHTDHSELVKIIDHNHETDLLAYPSGSKLLIEKLTFSSGGGGTNTAVCLARLGLKVAYLGKLGYDENGDRVIKELAREGVDFVGNRGSVMTGYSVILDSIEHDRTILAYKGANDYFDFKEIKKDRLRTKWLYFSAMMEKSFESMKQLAVYAKKNGIKIVFNPSSYLAELGIEHIKTVLDATEILVLNDEEAALLVGQGTIEEMLKRLKKYVPIVAITEGSKGCHVIDDRYIYRGPSHKVKPVETTGAGDAFASSFLAGILAKGECSNAIECAIQIGITNAESVILNYGAKNRLLTRKEAKLLMKKNPVKIIKKKYYT